MGGIPTQEAAAYVAWQARRPHGLIIDGIQPPPGFRGDPECLRWNRWDLECLDAALALTPGRKSVIQAGGNLGVFAAHLSPLFEAVYVFEPDALLFPLLVANAPQENIVRFQAALAEHPGSWVNTARTTPENTHAGVTHVSGRGPIPTVRIDDMGWQALDLLYLDVEGYELPALRGAEQTIRRLKPTIAVEANRCCERYGYTKADLFGFLTSLGYVERAKVHADHIWTAA